MLFFTSYHSATKKNKGGDVLKVASGLTSRTKFLKTPRQAFDYFITRSIKKEIIKHTNERIEEYQDNRTRRGKVLRSEHKIILDDREFDAFIGIQIYRYVKCSAHFCCHIDLEAAGEEESVTIYKCNSQ
jgi:hypothetical protein